MSSNSSDCSDPGPLLTPVWTSNKSNLSRKSLNNSRKSLSSVSRKSVKNLTPLKTVPDPPKYIHPLSPSFMMTSTPVRHETFFDGVNNSFVYNISHQCQDTGYNVSHQCLDTSEHNHSIGDIVDGNFVSFSTSDMYCISNNTEENREKQATTAEDDLIEKIDAKDKELLNSLCDNCRTSFCSKTSSSTLTLTEIEEKSEECSEEDKNSSTLSLKTLNAAEEDLSCESVITVETLDEENIIIDIDDDDVDIVKEEKKEDIYEEINIAIEDNEDEYEQMETKDIVPHEVIVEINTCDNSGSEV